MNLNLFDQARIRLTVWYVVIILVISASLSTLFYHRTSQVLDLEFNRIQTRLEREHRAFFGLRGSVPPVPQIIASEILEAKRNIAVQLLIVNGVIVLIVGAGGFVLSSKTLKPIEKSMEEQKRFISDAAHELRTPITALKTSLEVNLMDSSLSKETKKLLQENLEDVSGLETLSQGLLRLSKQDQNGIERKPVAISEVVAGAVRTIEPLAKRKKITIKQDSISKTFSARGEKESLKELMVILLDNAVKYSNAGKTVEIKTLKKNKLVELSVVDQGKGIAKHHLPHIFERFYRVDESRTKDGHGLGLSIAKKIVEQHGGEISAKSELGKGTTVTIKLPLV